VGREGKRRGKKKRSRGKEVVGRKLGKGCEGIG